MYCHFPVSYTHLLTMPKNNRQQAEFPADCVIFDNPVGTAPGCAFEAEGVDVYKRQVL